MELVHPLNFQYAMTYAAETNRTGTGSIILYFNTLRRECRSARKANDTRYICT